MTLNKPLLQELEQEAKNTRKILERVPEEHFGWKPHEKSFSLGRLATHIAELAGYISTTINTDELNFAAREYKPYTAASSSELLKIFDNNISQATEDLQKTTDEDFLKSWKMRNGEQVFFELPKIAVLRAMAFSHLIHHRGQLTVYLRLLNVPVPGIYGPSADEPM